MEKNIRILLGLVLVLFMSCCHRNPANETAGETVEPTGEVSETGNAAGEESGRQYGLEDTCRVVRKGVQLMLWYDKDGNRFSGIVSNVSDHEMERVRVEVHLSNGTELGPTLPQNLEPGAKIMVDLPAKVSDFEAWSAHAETGTSEHGHTGEGEHEHGEHGEEHENGNHR